MFRWVEAKQPFAIAMQDRRGGDHFRIEPRMTRELTVEDTAMPVSPIHHRRDAEAQASDVVWFFFHISSLRQPSCCFFMACLSSLAASLRVAEHSLLYTVDAVAAWLDEKSIGMANPEVLWRKTSTAHNNLIRNLIRRYRLAYPKPLGELGSHKDILICNDRSAEWQSLYRSDLLEPYDIVI